MIITALTENTSVNGFPTEHGLSLLIRTGSHRILFDAGQTGLFADNAQRLGIDLSQVDLAVLSHGHYDHGGGMMTFLSLNEQAPLYLSREAFGEYYNGTEKYIGLDGQWRESDRLVYVGQECVIDSHLTIFSSCGRTKPFPADSCGLNMRRDGVMHPDDFRHEQYLLIEEEGRRFLFSGCSHQGILNIMAWFRPDVFIGGFHLSKMPAGKALEAIAGQLAAYDTDYYTCHCTGTEQYEWMCRDMKRLHYLSCGETVTL